MPLDVTVEKIYRDVFVSLQEVSGTTAADIDEAVEQNGGNNNQAGDSHLIERTETEQVEDIAQHLQQHHGKKGAEYAAATTEK